MISKELSEVFDLINKECCEGNLTVGMNQKEYFFCIQINKFDMDRVCASISRDSIDPSPMEWYQTKGKEAVQMLYKSIQDSLEHTQRIKEAIEGNTRNEMDQIQ